MFSKHSVIWIFDPNLISFDLVQKSRIPFQGPFDDDDILLAGRGYRDVFCRRMVGQYVANFHLLEQTGSVLRSSRKLTVLPGGDDSRIARTLSVSGFRERLPLAILRNRGS